MEDWSKWWPKMMKCDCIHSIPKYLVENALDTEIVRLVAISEEAKESDIKELYSEQINQLVSLVKHIQSLPECRK